ncbi:MAG: electron transport complex subunit RsxB [Gammaproteobacteria bacterium]|nr:electron transport complex subunit RsxB [Gammaproteobacteria bacterium]MBU1980251.1 electron transport complex subunit RsxB [Gammaproteobacteria bacterium]
MLSAILVMILLGVVLGAVLGYASIKFRVEGNPLVEKVESTLPQTQCGQCGFAGCRPYAEAVAAGEAEINQCVPGGNNVAKHLAELLGVEYKPVGGEENFDHKPKMVAFIDENTCIGCTACIKVCPVDAIVGATKLMHTILADPCTGCELCIPACPVDCITMIPVKENVATWKRQFPIFELKKVA